MRNINTPRPLGIPNPVAYQCLCKYISEIWPQLQQYFEAETKAQEYIISRTHIRKMKGSDSLFSMNYKNWKDDGTPEPDLLLGANIWFMLMFQTVFRVYILMLFHGHWSVKM